MIVELIRALVGLASIVGAGREPGVTQLPDTIAEAEVRGQPAAPFGAVPVPVILAVPPGPLTPETVVPLTLAIEESDDWKVTFAQLFGLRAWIVSLAARLAEAVPEERLNLRMTKLLPVTTPPGAVVQLPPLLVE